MEKKNINRIALVFFILFIVIAIGFPVAIFITMDRNLEAVKEKTVVISSTLIREKEYYIITKQDTFKLSTTQEAQAEFGNLKLDSTYTLEINKKGKVFKIKPSH